MPDERDMVWLHRLTVEFHMRLFHRPITLSVITVDARRDKVFPCLFTGAGLRKDVIDSKCEIRAEAILASMTITP